MSHRETWRTSLALLALVAVSACSTTVERLDESQAVDLSGGWNDTDSRLVSQEMIQDSLSRPWLQEFQGRPGQTRPAVIVGEAADELEDDMAEGEGPAPPALADESIEDDSTEPLPEWKVVAWTELVATLYRPQDR